MNSIILFNLNAKTVKERKESFIREFIDSGGYVGGDNKIYDNNNNSISTMVSGGNEYIRVNSGGKLTTIPAIKLKGYYKFGDIVFDKKAILAYDINDNQQFLLDNLMINDHSYK